MMQRIRQRKGKKSKLKKSKLPNRGKVLLSLVSLTLGFILAFSYSVSQKNERQGTVDSSTYAQTEAAREELILQKERNKELSSELRSVQNRIREYEQQIGSDASLDELVNEAETLRLLTGDVPVKGPGYRVELSDGEYDPAQVNPNDYIVHEGHVYMVINELKIAGAEAISVNGKRIHDTSYIRCTGPVITVDGETFPAPFVVEAIGNQNTLQEALELNGGILDQLVGQQIVIQNTVLNEVRMASVHEESGE